MPPVPDSKTDRTPTPKEHDEADSSESEKTRENKDEEFLRIARKRFERVSSAESNMRRKAVEDLKFKQGDQWPESIKADRTMDKRPCLTINKMKTFVHQITNDQRQNRPQIQVSPVGDRSDPQTAKMLKGLIRQIERQSNADIAYDTGFDSAVSCGWGYWRVLTQYEDEDSFDQVVQIQRVRNPFRVYLDPDHQEPDGSDAKWGFISDLIPRHEFEEMYPDVKPLAWDQGSTGDEFKNWSSETHVRIAEYFYYEHEERKLVKLANGHEGWEDELHEEVKARLDDEDFAVDRRTVQTKKLRWSKITAHEILEEEDWLGKWIPIVKVIGDETEVEGKVDLAGLIRDAKDPARMYNYWVTAETEQLALMPKAPFIMEEGQVEGHEQRWKQANNKNYPYLLYKGVNLGGKPAPPPQRQQFAGPPAGVVQAKISAAQDIQAVTGIRFDATLQERTYDESGKALRELKHTGDLGNFHYVDNLARSLRHTGRILIDLIPKIYNSPRVLTILRDDDSEDRVHIDPTLSTAHGERTGSDGKTQKLYNPKLGRYDVAITIGPSYATKRAEAGEQMINFLKAVPTVAPLVTDLIAKNMDWPEADQLYARLASQLPPAMNAPNLKDLEPKVKAMILSMQQENQHLKQENQQAKALLGDKEADRQIARDQIKVQDKKADHDFEAKLTNIAMQMETKLAAVAQKMEQSNQAAFQNSMKMVTEEVKRMQERLDKQPPNFMDMSPMNNLAKVMEEQGGESEIEFKFNDQGRPIGARRKPVPKQKKESLQ
jgi:hypothetical protein